MSYTSSVIEMSVYYRWCWIKELSWRMWYFSVNFSLSQNEMHFSSNTLRLTFGFILYFFLVPTLFYSLISFASYIGAKRWNLSYPVFSLFNDCAGRRATWWPHLLQIHYSQEISRMFSNIREVPWESESRGPLLCCSPCDLPVTKSYWMCPKYLSSHFFSLRHLILNSWITEVSS